MEEPMINPAIGKITVAVLVFASLAGCSRPQNSTVVQVLANTDTTVQNEYYSGNRHPLEPLHFYKLPVGHIRPTGWLGKALQLQADGLTGKLGEISPWLNKDSSAWLRKDGHGSYGWEELPYWLKGYANIGYVLNRPEMIREAKTWIEAVLGSQRAEGDFGPIVYRNGKRDLWAHMLMLFCLQSYYEYSRDERVIPFMSRYFAWEQSIPDSLFLEDYWENSRGGDNLYSVYWLYNITGNDSLLSLAAKIHRNTANWEQDGSLPNWHNVNIAQCFREPATWFLQSHDVRDRAATYNDFHLVRSIYGQVPGGMFGSDENCRKGYTDPRQCIETCGMLEQMASDEMLFRFTGDPLWASNCEDVAYNTYPAAFMPDYRSLRYLTAPNMVRSDSSNHAPGIDNGGPFLMMNPFSSRCCQHNHSSGWVYFAENLNMATPDNGVAAIFYCSSRTHVKVGGGQELQLEEETHYPFDKSVTFRFHLEKPGRFPFYLRIPAWCRNARIRVNGQPVKADSSAGKLVRIDRVWSNSDSVTLELPMEPSVQHWPNNRNSVTVNYGPLSFSLAIREKYEKLNSALALQGDAKWQPGADPEKWPSYEIFPASSWNYGLLLDSAGLPQNLAIRHRPWPADDNPFTFDNAPLEMITVGRKIPEWTIDQYGLCGTLPQSPVKTASGSEEIRLIPMGAARLRISSFPVVN